MQLLIASFLVSLVGGARVAVHDTSGEQGRWRRKVQDPDVKADMVQIVRRHGYPIETHEVITEDGYILTNFRIPHGIAEAAPAAGKPVVLVQHALLCSSFDWVANSPQQSLGFLLADAGFDVWFGNNRGDSYSLNHTTLSRKSDSFWNFTYDEMAKYDLPAQIEYALRATGRSSLGFVGHSQGTLQAFAGFSSNPELARKVDLFVALAPVAWVHHQRSRVFKHMAKMDTAKLFKRFGIREFGTSDAKGGAFINRLGSSACKGFLKKMCNRAIFLFCGKTTHINASRINVYLSHTPAGTSVKNMDHWSQGVLGNNFQRYRYPTEEQNLLAYGQSMPLAYDLSKLHVKTALFTGGNDILVDPQDLQNVLDTAPNVVFHKNIEDYGHLDFAWAYDAEEYVYQDLKALLREHLK